MHIEEQVFDRDRFGRAPSVGSDVTADQLDQVVEHEAEGKLEDGRLRPAPNQALQVKNLGNFLKDLLNAPALEVMFE